MFRVNLSTHIKHKILFYKVNDLHATEKSEKIKNKEI